MSSNNLPPAQPGANVADGLCHNAQRGSYGHECSKPATWVGTKASGWQSGFCDRCKEHGDEAKGFVAWEPHPRLLHLRNDAMTKAMDLGLTPAEARELIGSTK